MSIKALTAWKRPERKKGAARRLRRTGRIPAVLYGGDRDPVALAIDPLALAKTMDPELRRNTLLKLEVEDAPEVSCLAMVKDFQADPIRDELIHVDLIRITEGQLVEVTVPLVVTGRAEGVKQGGRLQQVFREVPIRAKATEIPPKLELDSTSWILGTQIRVSEVPLTGNISILLPPKQTIAAIVAGRTAEEEAKPAEGEEAAAGEETGEAAKAETPAAENT